MTASLTHLIFSLEDNLSLRIESLILKSIISYDAIVVTRSGFTAV